MLGEEDRYRQIERPDGKGGVVAALGLEADGKAELANEIARPDAGGNDDAVEAVLGASAVEEDDSVGGGAERDDPGGDQGSLGLNAATKPGKQIGRASCRERV